MSTLIDPLAGPVTAWEEIETRIVGWLAAIPEIEQAFDHEPENLPAKLPVTTLCVRMFEPIQAATGYLADQPVDDVSFGWRLRLYVQLDNYKRAQAYVKAIVPQIIKIQRDHPTCDGIADFLRITDPGDVPTFSHLDGWLFKDLTVIAVRSES